MSLAHVILFKNRLPNTPPKTFRLISIHFAVKLNVKSQPEPLRFSFPFQFTPVPEWDSPNDLFSLLIFWTSKFEDEHERRCLPVDVFPVCTMRWMYWDGCSHMLFRGLFIAAGAWRSGEIWGNSRHADWTGFSMHTGKYVTKTSAVKTVNSRAINMNCGSNARYKYIQTISDDMARTHNNNNKQHNLDNKRLKN